MADVLIVCLISGRLRKLTRDIRNYNRFLPRSKGMRNLGDMNKGKQDGPFLLI